jgi:hypothetical protein
MLDPLTYALRAQQAAAVGALCLGGTAVASWLHLLKGERSLILPTMHRRAIERHAPAKGAPGGAGWTDHYGRRSQDVDVEHMR